jgi:hypothetical protein
MKLTIVSGGQTGADRGALDAAIALGLDFGGWAPARFASEDGRIPEIYASHMREAADTGEVGRNLALRTRLNVQDSDATLIVSFASELTGGSKFTASTAKQQRKNSLHLVLPARGETRIPDAVRSSLLAWLRKHRVEVLNVAGPRESKEPGLQAAVRDALVWMLEDEVSEDLRAGAVAMQALAETMDQFGQGTPTQQSGAGCSSQPVVSAGANPAPDTAPVTVTFDSFVLPARSTAPDCFDPRAPADGTIEPAALAALETSIRQAEAEIREAVDQPEGDSAP